MKVDVKKVDAVKRELKFEIPKERVTQSFNEVYKDNHLRVEGAAGACLAAAKKLRNDQPVAALMTGENISDSVFHELLQSVHDNVANNSGSRIYQNDIASNDHVIMSWIYRQG